MSVADPTLEFERRLLADGATDVIIAIDEVGRGALAGPVTIGAVAIGAHTEGPPVGVRDSKALSAKKREELAPVVRAWVLASAVVDVPASRIDETGIIRALGEGAAQAARNLNQSTTASSAIIVLDGHHDFLSPIDDSWPVHTVVKGDAKCASVAAASIIAKVHRDALMRELHQELPQFGWDRNAGYGTQQHRSALIEYGVSVYHRRSWQLIDQPTLDL